MGISTSYISLKDDLEKKEEELKGTEEAFGVNLLTFPGYLSSSRGVMWYSHLKSFVNLLNGSFPHVFTNNENLVGDSSIGYKKAKHDFEVIAKIPRFRDKPEHLYYLILFDKTTKEYIIQEKRNVESLTEKFGFEYNNEAMDTAEVGDVIKEGTVMFKSTSYDDDMNYCYGDDAEFIYEINNLTIEDAIGVREGYANNMISMEVEDITVTANDNDFFGNWYGDEKHYKILPDIGEHTKDGVICVKKRMYNNQKIYDMKKSNLMKIQFGTDVPYFADGILEDVFVYCNKEIEDIPETPFNEQILYYLREQKAFFTALYDECLRIIESGENYSRDIRYWFQRSANILDPDFKWRDDDSIFSNMIIEFTVKKEAALDTGSKVTGRHGNKGVISTIIPDEQMPFRILPDGTKKPVDFIINALGVINRLNSFQLFELSLNHISRSIREKFIYEDLTVDQKKDILFKYISIVNADEFNELKPFYESLTTKEREAFFKSIEDDGIYIHANLLYEDRPIFFKIMDVYDAFDWLGYDEMYIHKWGRDIKVLRPMISGDMYFIKLKQNAKKGFSARSLSGISVKNVPEKSNKSKIHLEPYSKTPVRMGNQEFINNSIGLDAQTVADLNKAYRSSPSARRGLGELLTSSREPDAYEFKDNDININAQVLNAYFKARGIAIEHSDDYYDIPIYDNDISDIETPEGNLVIGDERDIHKEQIKNMIKESYRKGIRSFVGTNEDYEATVDRLAEDFIFEEEGGLVVHLDD